MTYPLWVSPRLGNPLNGRAKNGSNKKARIPAALVVQIGALAGRANQALRSGVTLLVAAPV
jgi:hypothetical protein